MGYYVRVFCTAPDVPRLRSIQDWLHDQESTAVIDEPNHAIAAAAAGELRPPILNLSNSNWEQIAISYKLGKPPILAECDRDDGTPDSTIREELEEFVQQLAEVEHSSARQRVLDHLAATKFVVVCQLPVSSIDDDGYEANGDFLTYFVEHCGGMVQADAEGFYDGEELLVELE